MGFSTDGGSMCLFSCIPEMHHDTVWPSVMLRNDLVSWPLPQRSRSPKRLPTWWRTVTHTYARTPSSYPCLPPRTPSGRRSSSAPSSDEPPRSAAATAPPGSSVSTTPEAPGCGHWVEFCRVDTVVGQLCPGGWGFWGSQPPNWQPSECVLSC